MYETQQPRDEWHPEFKAPKKACYLLQDQKVGYTDYPFLDDNLVCELEEKLKT